MGALLTVPATDVRWLVSDQLGTPRMTVDLTGSLSGVRRHDYLPFGEELSVGGRTQQQGYAADGVRLKFTGYERDGETNLDYAQARYYASAQGRFTSVDPLFIDAKRLPDPQVGSPKSHISGGDPMTGLLLSFMLALLPQTPQTKKCDGDAGLKKLAGDSDVILIAEVKSVEPTFELQPWSGGLIGSIQHVLYDIRWVLKGEMPESEMRVGFYLVKNSMTAGKGRPHLSPELFKEQTVHIVFLDFEPKQPRPELWPPLSSSYTAVSADCGAIVATPDAEAAIRRVLSHTEPVVLP